MHTRPSSQMHAPFAAGVAAVTALALLLAGCGGSQPPAAGSPTGATAQNGAGAAYKYAACIRSHGVTNFPDPKVVNKPGSQGIMQGVPAGVAGTPKFKSAQRACRGILPAANGPSPGQQHARLQDLLAFTRCLRGHGIANFPDPNSQGDLSPQTVRAAGVNMAAPAFLTAARKCVGVTHGALTMASVRQAIAHYR